MRRYKKEDIQRAAELLEEANNSIAKTAKSNPQQAVDILMDCEKLAILVGNHLETRGEICAPIVSMLEEYCEEIYQMAANISDAGQVKKKSCLIEKQLVRLKNAIASDMPEDKKEVVFLPYKASMWDSLESVWKAAEADADTDAYVIPIPYYDKNPDGSFREFHYEGDLYPDDVPVTHYREYDFEERRPDAIYIHNPYDEANYVTSVEPFFYSKNLKKYTDCLVYIPYYATTGGMAEGQALCPAYLYADYIVIQSDNHRKYFDAGLPNEKFLAFGSPKYAFVCASEQSPYESHGSS